MYQFLVTWPLGLENEAPSSWLKVDNACKIDIIFLKNYLVGCRDYENENIFFNKMI